MYVEAKPIREPEPSVELAECVGILMGDGGISQYQVVVSLHCTDDKAYSLHVARLMHRLFGVQPRIYHRPKESLSNITISRRKLVLYLQTIGLPVGNKLAQGLDIPDWILANQNYRTACLRGLVDTDGSVFTHRYKVKEKWYAYKKLSFTSASPSLLTSVSRLLKDLGMHPRIGSNKDVRLDSIADMKRYFAVVGSNNEKHLRRYGF